ncbi:hypothetical protein [Polyangium sp. y55x31]|uniref:hypothetical protein n=1 Tax=Polyangium sp. y55x31 TaxID=3042688 RepID=UPI00248212CA|nr:hypothetical protein [Polyangium sp. y55x31]MDI1478904.1 hypothetical protein [Polyangium sp. y55x31]
MANDIAQLRKDLRQKLIKLEDCLEELNTSCGDASSTEAKLAQLFRKLDDVRGEAAALLPSLRRTEADFASFFAEVGRSVLSAQESLDAASRVYLKNNKNAKHVPPTVYRIPRVTADMKFSLESIGSKNVNVVFYSKEEKVRDLHQQSVQLEIVAVPAPPDYDRENDDAGGESNGPGVASAVTPEGPKPMVAEALTVPAAEALPMTAAEAPALVPLHIVEAAASAPAARPLAGPAEREGIFAAVAAAKGKTAAETRSLRKRLLLDHRDHVLIFANQHRTAYFLILATEGKKPELALWQLGPARGELTLLHRFPTDAASRKRSATLHRHLARLGKLQAHALQSRKEA